MKKKTKLMLGDNIESLRQLPDNSIDSIVTDPPYGLSFMGKKWDYDVPSVQFWKEVYRVLKPGGHILSFGGTRTYHRMVVNIEDAGFEIRDQVMWLYGSGFPKSHNIGKAVDKIEGNEREVIGTKNDFALDGRVRKPEIHKPMNETINSDQEYGYKQGWDTPVTKGQSKYEGWGSSLKPANEPICVARKPLSEKTIAENVIKWGTGGINIDGCRVGTDAGEGRFPANIILECCCDETIDGGTIKSGSSNRTDKGVVAGVNGFGRGTEIQRETQVEIHTNPNCPCYQLDLQSGVTKSTGAVRKKDTDTEATSIDYKHKTGELSNPYAGQVGGASRYFYVAKVSKKERNLGTEKNNHPTLKPINLMTYLCRLVTPEGGIVLDPFMGSGSTGIAALLEGFRFVGMEMDKDYFKIAEARIEAYEEYRKLIK
jgi:site-specific DNA-methyltransferase (adenine-specific)